MPLISGGHPLIYINININTQLQDHNSQPIYRTSLWSWGGGVSQAVVAFESWQSEFWPCVQYGLFPRLHHCHPCNLKILTCTLLVLYIFNHLLVEGVLKSSSAPIFHRGRNKNIWNLKDYQNDYDKLLFKWFFDSVQNCCLQRLKMAEFSIFVEWQTTSGKSKLSWEL